MNKTLKRLTISEVMKWFMILANIVMTIILFVMVGEIKPTTTGKKMAEYSEEEFKNIVSIQKECYPSYNNDDIKDFSQETDNTLLPNTNMNHIVFTQYDVPDINSDFKAYMDYRRITNTSSDQYKLIHTEGYVDEHGFMRVDSGTETEGEQDYYMIALGSYYGTEIGTKYRITTDAGRTFYGILADCKDNIHTDSTNRYTVVGTPNVVEFIVDTDSLIYAVKYHGTASRYEPLSGKIISIEKMKFVGC